MRAPGYTHAACMAELGHEVLGVDIDADKVALLNAGRAWFLEPDLNELLARTRKLADSGSPPASRKRRGSAPCTSLAWARRGFPATLLTIYRKSLRRLPRSPRTSPAPR